MRVVLLEPRGMCAGVQRAIRCVELALARYGPPIHVRRPIVHNRAVVAALARRGALFVEELAEVPAGARVIFSAHGVAPAVRAEAAARGLRAIDATCPLVRKVHQKLLRALADGCAPVLVGDAGHDEVLGTLGHAPPGALPLIGTPDEARALQLATDRRVVVLTQTTLSTDDTAEILAVLRARFPDLASASDICYATQNRQDAVREVAAELDFLLVVGSPSSANSARLVRAATRAGLAAALIEDAAALAPRRLAGATAIGITAGASTPEALVADVVARLRDELGAETVEHRRFAEERVSFALPAELDPDREENDR